MKTFQFEMSGTWLCFDDLLLYEVKMVLIMRLKMFLMLTSNKTETRFIQKK